MSKHKYTYNMPSEGYRTAAFFILMIGGYALDWSDKLTVIQAIFMAAAIVTVGVYHAASALHDSLLERILTHMKE